MKKNKNLEIQIIQSIIEILKITAQFSVGDLQVTDNS